MKKIKVGTKVKRGKETGRISQYNPSYKACISVEWDSGYIEGWFDIEGTDGTKNKERHITIL